MNSKISPSQKHINKLLDYIAEYKCLKDGTILINDKFYAGLPSLSKTQIIQILNAMEAENIIEKFPPCSPYNCPTLKLTVYAFSYKLRMKDKRMRFWIPIITSNAIAIASLIIAILAYIKQ